MFFTKHKDDNDIKIIDTVLTEDEFDRVKTDFSSFDLKIKAGNSYKVEYHGPAYIKPEIKLDDDTLEITEPDLREKEIKRWEKGSFKIELNFSTKASVTVTVPKNRPLEELDLKLRSGNVDLSDFASDEIELESASGNLTVEDIRVGSFDATVNSGDIVFDNVRLDDSEISLTSGNFKLLNSRIMNQMSIATVSGDNLVQNTQVAEANLHTVSGDNRIFGEQMKRGKVGQDDGSFLRMTTISGNNRIE